jgi:hypothetical protein
MANLNKMLLAEKFRNKRKFPWLKCKVEGNTLSGKGKVQPTPQCSIYTVEFTFTPPYQPEIYITDPEIEYFYDIHLYKAGKPPHPLCLYYPKDHLKPVNGCAVPAYRWQESLPFGLTIIPWISEWIVCYEIWLLTGRWAAPEIHGYSDKQD